MNGAGQLRANSGIEGSVAVPWARLRIPAFPQIAVRVLQLAGGRAVSMRQLSDLISSDPAFCSEVLTIVNSLVYAPRFPVTSILQAVAMLGTHNLKGICLTVGVRAYLGKSLSHPAMRCIWRHNLATALVAQQLAIAGVIDKDKAYTAGILHDMGRLAFAALQPTGYSALLSTHTGSARSILASEKSLFGVDHCEAGRNLVHEWKLPPELETVVSLHHNRRESSAWQIPDLIHVSCRLADSIGFPAFQGCIGGSYHDLLAEVPGPERDLFPSNVESLSFTIGSKINAVESL